MTKNVLGFRFILIFFIATLALVQCTTSKKDISRPTDSDLLHFQVSEAVKQSDYFGIWDSIMPKKGILAPDFTIHSVEGDIFNLSEQLKKGRPILLVNGSYTCDLSRRSLPKIDALYQKYGSKIDIFIIYTMEAHPMNHPSPYSRENSIWIRSENLRDSIAAKKPETYGERKTLSRQWKEKFKIQPKILLDNPENDYWTLYGQAPNMVYLINSEGIIIERQINFHRKKIEDKMKDLLKM
ncbi:TlpA family protein disulfide reductase [Spongiimicrobium salis]|uniref:TlpA family protein disulfide reductase n=1 Tax=Spongiimicrobium salis TaxID=1667022 RepID=UPI00374CCF94